MPTFKDYLFSLRPWSFTASVIPVFIVAVVTKTPFLSLDFARAIVMAICIQSAANLTNTYYDYAKGVDTKKNNADDTLVEGKLSKDTVLYMSYFFYAIGMSTVMSTSQLTQGSWEEFNLINLSTHQDLAIIFATGLILAYFYTATPVGLKYMALGDLTILLCFGPLLFQAVGLMFTGKLDERLYWYSVPIALYTEAILHANNARDIEADSNAKATTLAVLLGLDYSYIFYALLFVFAYGSVLYIALYHHWACAFNLLIAPMTAGLLNAFRAGKMKDLPEETAKTHMLFGVTLFLGILGSQKGLLEVDVTSLPDLVSSYLK
jgi:1,4-dihydroxy-2-naphthoate octaprenyltransferase